MYLSTSVVLQACDGPDQQRDASFPFSDDDKGPDLVVLVIT